MALASPQLRGTRHASVVGTLAQCPLALNRCPVAASSNSAAVLAHLFPIRNGQSRVGHQRLAAATPSDSQAASTATVTASELDVGYSSAQGARDTMEDEVQVHYNTVGHYLYAAVFDGHGGDHAARWLAKQLHVQVESCLIAGLRTRGGGGKGPNGAGDSASGTLSSRDIRATQLVESFHLADAALLSHLTAEGGEEAAGAGSTATVAVIKDDRLVVANVGDSQAVLSRKGNAVTLAHYHRVYGSGPDVASEIERIKSVGGWVDDGRVCGVLAVSRAFGDWEFKGNGLPRLLESGIERGFWDASFAAAQQFSSDPVVATPDVTETQLCGDDEFLIVASDGLWDVLPPREAVAWARKEFRAKKDASQVAASLTGLALKRYSTDNVAVVVVDLQGPEFWSAKPKSRQQAGAGSGGARKPGGGFFGGLFKSG